MLLNGQSAAKPRTEERSTTIPQGSTTQAIGVGSGTYFISVNKLKVNDFFDNRESNCGS